MKLKIIAVDLNIRRHFYNEESYQIFLEEMLVGKMPAKLIDLQGWCNFRTGQVLLGRSTTHSSLRVQSGLPSDNLYPFTFYLEPGTRDLELVYGSSTVSEIAGYLKAMVDHILLEYLIEPAGFRVIDQITQRLQN